MFPNGFWNSAIWKEATRAGLGQISKMVGQGTTEDLATSSTFRKPPDLIAKGTPPQKPMVPTRPLAPQAQTSMLPEKPVPSFKPTKPLALPTRRLQAATTPL